jgi:hypothetical protein
MSHPANEPRLFALSRQHGDSHEIVGYGLVLPDGSTYSVSWPPGHGAGLHSSESAEHTAFVFNADLCWIHR